MSNLSLTEKIPDYFADVEFERCTPACKKVQMSSRLLYRLNSARHMAGVPFILNSAYRSVDWEHSKGRSGKGYHTKGRAVDIRCVDSDARWKIINAATACGLNGIGIAKTYIHLDDRDIPSIWLYE